MSSQSEMRQRGAQGSQRERESTEGAEQMKQQGKEQMKSVQHTAEQLLDQGNVKAHQLASQLQQNPKLATGLLLLTAFIMGMALTGLVGKMGYGPAGSGWKYTDPQSIQAHQALDTLLGQVYEMKSMGGDRAKIAAEKLGELKDKAASMDKTDMLKEGAKAYMGIGMKEKLAEGVRGIKNIMLGREEKELTMSEKLAAGAQNLKEKLTGKPVDNSLKGKINQAEQKLKELLHNAIHA